MKNMPMPRPLILLTLIATAVLPAAIATRELQAAELDSLVAALHAVGSEGDGNAAAATAWQELAQLDAGQLPELLAALDDARPLTANWIRAAVDAVAERHLQRGEPLPQEALESFVRDTGHAPRARRLAFEWLARIDQDAHDRLLPSMLDDPSVELRRDAVARLIDSATVLLDGGDRDAAVAAFRQAFTAARDIDQIKQLAARLKDLDQEVDLPAHFGFIQTWQLIGPFDNTDSAGYATTYPPEESLDTTAEYEGKHGTVAWSQHTTSEDYGLVDLNEAVGKESDVVAYAWATLVVPAGRPAEVRLTTVNANQVWVNGQPIGANEVYHAGSDLDQYVMPCTLKAGENQILVKVCQNAMTESWAQKWQFQLRVCDEVGTAIPSTTRNAAPTQ